MFLDKIRKIINTGVVKSHARCDGIEIPHLVHRHIDLSQEDSVLTIRCGRHVETLELTKHKSGTFYMHWIRLNQCLIRLHLKVSDFYSWVFRPPLDSFASPFEAVEFARTDENLKFLTVDILGFSREHIRAAGLSVVKVRKQYRKLSRLFHPDLGGDATIFREVKKAKDHLLENLTFDPDAEWEAHQAERAEYEQA